MKVFLFILFIFSVTSALVNEKIPLNTYIAKIRKELKEISSLHSIEELTYDDFNFVIDDVTYTLSSVNAKAVFFNEFMPVPSVTNQINLTIEFDYKLPEGSTLSPYHSIYRADLSSNNKAYQIEFEVESGEFKFTKYWQAYSADKIFVPLGSSEFTFVSLKAKNLDENSPYTEEIILKVVNEFLNKNKEKMNKAFSDTVVGYYKSLPFEEYGQKIYIRTSGEPNEVNFDLSLEEMPYYENKEETGECVYFERKGIINTDKILNLRFGNEVDTNQRFNIHGSIYQQLISDNLFGFDIEQTNNPATMYTLIAGDLKKVANLNESIPDETELKLEAKMKSVTFDPTYKTVGDLNLIVDIISKEDQTSLLVFNAKFKFTLNPTLVQNGLNFVLLSKNIELSEVTEESGAEITNYDTLIQWIQNTYLCGLSQNEYNLFENALDLSYYFNSNDLSFEFMDEYLSIKKN